MPDDEGSLWLDTSCGLVRIPRDHLAKWIADSKHTILTTVFDAADCHGELSNPYGFSHPC